ncbi:GTPase-activator protein for Ras-like GTPase [Sesbania bispinosa]|nr:GTPase-activator protein for Ras-like GTPase [Sesbania bispinosa]
MFLDVARKGCACFFVEGMLEDDLRDHPNDDVRKTYNVVADALEAAKKEWERLYGSNKQKVEGSEDNVCGKVKTINNEVKKDIITNEEGCSKNM